MAQVSGSDVERMTAALFIERGWRSPSASRFWVLLLLAAVIATAGLIADSTATVIGAMIVAPLMTPILGIALAVVLAERRALLHSVFLVLAGALAVIAVAYLLSWAGHPLDAYASNGQVAARISPRLIDLVAALATGLVGAFALVRSDISDTLPGVAIAISLVPPLAVVGLLLQVQRYADASQALLLFATNVAAIVATGTLVLLGYRVRGAAEAAGHPVGRVRGLTLAIVIGAVVVVAVPLGLGSAAVTRDQVLSSRARPLAEAWAQSNGWQATNVTAVHGLVVVTALGPPPDVDPSALRRSLDAAGLGDADLSVRLVVGGQRWCPAGSTVCTASAPTAS